MFESANMFEPQMGSLTSPLLRGQSLRGGLERQEKRQNALGGGEAAEVNPTWNNRETEEMLPVMEGRKRALGSSVPSSKFLLKWWIFGMNVCLILQQIPQFHIQVQFQNPECSSTQRLLLLIIVHDK